MICPANSNCSLPLAVTISLAYSMMKMMKDQNLVRHLEACETMGGATNICSDKTGTLTENRMTVEKIWVAGKEFEGEPEGLNESVAGLFAEGVSVNSSAYIERGDKKKKKKDGDNKDKDKEKAAPRKQTKEEKAIEEAKSKNAQGENRPVFVGSKTECALLEYTNSSMHANYEEIRSKHEKNVVKLYVFCSMCYSC